MSEVLVYNLLNGNFASVVDLDRVVEAPRMGSNAVTVEGNLVTLTEVTEG